MTDDRSQINDNVSAIKVGMTISLDTSRICQPLKLREILTHTPTLIKMEQMGDEVEVWVYTNKYR